MKRMATLVASSAILLGSSALHAADASGCYGAFYTNFDMMQISENHFAVSMTAFGTGYVTNDPNSPAMGASGPCVIMNEIQDGNIAGMGRCVRTDREGEQFAIIGTFDRFTEAGGPAGTWKLEGMSGKWVGATGAGNFWTTGGGDTHYFACFDGDITLN